MIDFDKVLEHVGGFGKYQITSKLCQIASPCRRTPKRAIWDGPRPDYLRAGMNGSMIKCPVNFRTRDFQKLFSLWPIGYGNIHTSESEAKRLGALIRISRGRASKTKLDQSLYYIDYIIYTLFPVVNFQGRQNMQ